MAKVEKSSRSGDFFIFICIYAKKTVILQRIWESAPMNSIFIVLPILTLLMFDLGLTLKPEDFKLIAQRPKPVIVGLVGQIILLPLIAWAIIHLPFASNLSPLFIIGIMLVACSPGGSSSNVFSMLA